MNHQNEANRREESQKLQVWCCEHCTAVHFKVGNVMLDFTKNEFTELTRAMLEIYNQEFGGLEFYRLINSLDQPTETPDQDDEILSSRTIF